MEVALRAKDSSSRVLQFYQSATRSSLWLFCVGLYPALMAASIPWSSTPVAVFTVLWLIALIPTILGTSPRVDVDSLSRRPVVRADHVRG
jgi:hypothetical protein